MKSDTSVIAETDDSGLPQSPTEHLLHGPTKPQRDTEAVEADLQARLAEDSPLSAEEVTQRASELAALVGEMLTAIHEEETQGTADGSLKIPLNPEYAERLNTGSSGGKIVRGDGPSQSTNPNSAPASNMQDIHPSANTNHQQSSPLPIENQRQSGVQPMAKAGSGSPVTLEEVAKHEEALRYLLHHLKEIKDRV